MKDRAANRKRGAAAKAAGDAWEAFVEAQHEMALYLKVLLHVAHNQPGTKFVHGRLIHVAKSGTDFTGLLADGRMLAAECKTTVGRLMRSEVKTKQAEQLDVVSRVGGASYLLVEFRDGPSKIRCAIPWRDVPWTKLRSAESIGVDDVVFGPNGPMNGTAWLIQPGTCYLKPGVQVPAGASGKRRVFPRE